MAVGPQLWWGANPEIMAKYRRTVSIFDVTLMDEEQFSHQGSAVNTSAAVPEQKTRKTTLSIETHLGHLGLQLGGIWGGSPKVGEAFLDVNNGNAYRDHVHETVSTVTKVVVGPIAASLFEVPPGYEVHAEAQPDP